MKISDQYTILLQNGFTMSTIERMDAEEREYEAEAYAEASIVAQIAKSNPSSLDPTGQLEDEIYF